MERVSAHNFRMSKRSESHDKFCREIAPRLAIAVKESGREQVEIARALGVSKSAVSQWLDTGKIASSQIPLFAKATGVSVEWLMTGADLITREDAAWLAKLKKLPESKRRDVQSYVDVSLVAARDDDETAPENNHASNG